MGATLRRCWHATGAISSSSWLPTPHPTFHPNSTARVRGIGFSCFFSALCGGGGSFLESLVWPLAVLACTFRPRNVSQADILHQLLRHGGTGQQYVGHFAIWFPSDGLVVLRRFEAPPQDINTGVSKGSARNEPQKVGSRQK